jgi:hypothetical protein
MTRTRTPFDDSSFSAERCRLTITSIASPLVGIWAPDPACQPGLESSVAVYRNRYDAGLTEFRINVMTAFDSLKAPRHGTPAGGKFPAR